MFVLAAVLPMAACWGGRGDRPDIFLIVVDALRFDHVMGAGVAPELTPALAGLGREATVFRCARAQSSWTMPSIASLFDSRYPSQHGVSTFKSRLGESETTLAELLQKTGYRTAAFSGNVLVSTASGFGQGFDAFISLGTQKGAGASPPAKPRAAEIDRELFRWLDSLPTARPPLFVYLHYMETHTPYAPEPEVLEAVLAQRRRTPEQRRRLGDLVFHPESFTPGPEMASLLEDLYAGEVVSFDRQLARLLEGLDARGLLERSLVVVTADHGEEFFEHQSLGHGRTLFDEVLRVPLLMRSPGAAAPPVDEPVSLVDVAPTLLAAAGVSPPASFEGRSLGPFLGGFSTGERIRSRLCRRLGLGCPAKAPSYAELVRVPGKADSGVHHRRSLVQGEEKTIQASDGSLQAYDLHESPLETESNRLPADRAEPLRAALVAMSARTAGAAASEERPAVDAETRERMRALGYTADE